MKNMKEFKEWLEKEIDVWETHYDMTSYTEEKKLCNIQGRLQELIRIKEWLEK